MVLNGRYKFVSREHFVPGVLGLVYDNHLHQHYSR